MLLLLHCWQEIEELARIHNIFKRNLLNPIYIKHYAYLIAWSQHIIELYGNFKQNFMIQHEEWVHYNEVNRLLGEDVRQNVVKQIERYMDMRNSQEA